MNEAQKKSWKEYVFSVTEPGDISNVPADQF